MMKKTLFLLIYITSCCANRTAVSTTDNGNLLKEGFVQAEITHPEGMAGCGFLLKIDSIHLQPLNLHDSLQVDKLKVWVKYHPEKERMSVCMMGPVVTIDEIRLRE